MLSSYIPIYLAHCQHQPKVSPLGVITQMVEQLYTAGRVHNVINIRNFIELPGKEVEDLTKDLIKHIVELYTGPDHDAETDKDKSEQL